MSTLSLVAMAVAGACVLFALLYLVARRLNNYGSVDIVWSYAFALLVGFYALAGSGWPARRAMLAAMVAVWAVRLGTHLLFRIVRLHPKEDTRYVQLRHDWAENFSAKMFGFFQLQGISVVLLGIVFLFPVQNAAAQLHPLEIAGAGLWLLALAGETIADAQLAAFKRDPAHRGQVCDVGWWRYSRHPNYFFEWLIWVAYATFALTSPLGWLGLIAPAILLYLLLCVTGVPLAEQQSLRSRGDAYRRYQQATSAFVPWKRTSELKGER
jgi:steroid 5-alpha reductase family enzyme